MMTLRLDYFGCRYDDTVPSFVNASDKLVWHRPRNRYLDKPALQAAMAADKYTPPAQEMGDAHGWLATNLGVADMTTKAGPPKSPTPAQTPVTAVVTGTGTKTIAITMGGGPATTAGTLTVANVKVDGTAIAGLTAITIAKADTAKDVAAALAAMMDNKKDAGNAITIHTTVNGNAVNVTQVGSTGAGQFDAGVTATVA